MPQIVAVSLDGQFDANAGALVHDGQEYEGPVFDVPPDVAVALTARPNFRFATNDDLEAAPASGTAKRGSRARKATE